MLCFDLEPVKLRRSRPIPKAMSSPPAATASVIVPLHDDVEATLRCLEAIEKNTPPELYEAVLVDDGCGDATSELLDALEGDVTVVRDGRGLGFARAANRGARAATGRYLVFLRDGAEPQPGWLEALIGRVESDPGVGVVGARVVGSDGLVRHAGVVVVHDQVRDVLRGELRLTGRPAHDPEAMVAYEPKAVDGAVLLVRREAFESVGGFDEGGAGDGGDGAGLDLCLALGERGWRVAYAPDACIVHDWPAPIPELHDALGDHARHLSDRWLGRTAVDVAVTADGAFEPPVATSADTPDRNIVHAMMQLTRRAALQQPGHRARLDGMMAELARERLWLEEEERLLTLARAGRDVCWEDEHETEPLVTIRIPTFNRGPMLAERAIASALAQTYERIEVLVVGDACDEATAKAAASTGDPRVRFVNLPRQGVYPTEKMNRWRVAGVDPVNVALSLASGSWIAPCDDDDELTPDHVEVLLAHARSERLEMVYSKARAEIRPGAWIQIGEWPPRHGGISHGTVLYAAPLRFMKYSTTCWKLREPADWNLWKRMQAIGVRMGFLDRVTFVHYVEAHLREP